MPYLDPEKRKEARRRWEERNKASRKAASDKWREANREYIRKFGREYNRTYRKQNRAGLNAYNASRRAMARQATPGWADKAAIREIYEEAVRLTAMTGVRFHVDHIVPLKGKNVCGLHTQDNLRVVPHYENESKGNRWQVL
jgi:hypothetical protein